MTPLRRHAEAIHRLGARPLYELLIEIGTRTDRPELVADIAAEFAGIDPEILVVLGGNAFPIAPLRSVG